jgi:hypothetical protein
MFLSKLLLVVTVTLSTNNRSAVCIDGRGTRVQMALGGEKERRSIDILKDGLILEQAECNHADDEKRCGRAGENRQLRRRSRH